MNISKLSNDQLKKLEADIQKQIKKNNRIIVRIPYSILKSLEKDYRKFFNEVTEVFRDSCENYNPCSN